MVHLVASDDAEPPAQMQLEHFAFRARGYDAVIERLDAERVEYWLADVPGGEIRQIHLKDRDGNHVELGFDRRLEKI